MMNKLYFYCLALFVAPTFSAFGQTQPSQDENGYYLIESAEHLKWFRDQVNASEHEQVDTNGDGQINMDDDTVVRLNAKLTADIDLGGESWTPIGEYNNGEEPDEVRFGGYFDGQGHVIKGLNVQPIDGRQSYGLFGYVAWGVVKNLGIVGGTVTSKADDGQEYTGAISGMLSYGRIENCFSTATVSGTAEGSIGGLTGGMRKISSVSNSYNAGTVIDPAGMAGGITGYIGSDASVYNCYNMGKVTGGAISGDDCSESTLRSGEEELPSIIDCYYLEGAGSGTLAKALSASDFVTTINEKLFTDPNNGEDFPWDGKANLAGDRLSVPTFDSSSVVEVPLDDDPTATEIIAKGESHIQVIDGRICITTSEPMKVRVVNIAGQTVRTVSLSDGYSEMTGLAEGVYIVVLEDGTCVKVLLR